MPPQNQDMEICSDWADSAPATELLKYTPKKFEPEEFLFKFSDEQMCGCNNS